MRCGPGSRTLDAHTTWTINFREGTCQGAHDTAVTQHGGVDHHRGPAGVRKHNMMVLSILVLVSTFGSCVTNLLR